MRLFLLLLALVLGLDASGQLNFRNPGFVATLAAPASGGGGGFTPASLTNLYLWYNASAATNVAGTGAEFLVDQSGNGRNMTQSTSGSRPIFNTGQVNGLPAWTFDGSDDSVGGTFNPGSSYGIFVLIQPTTVNEMRGFFDSAPSSANTFRMAGTGGSSLSVEIHDAAPFINQTGFSAAETLVYDYRVQVTGGRALDSTKNLGTAVTGTNTSTTAVNWNNPRIGNINNGAPYWPGKIVQVIITSPYGSGTDRTNIVNYLKGLGGL